MSKLRNPFWAGALVAGVGLVFGLVLAFTVNPYLGAGICVGGTVGGLLIAARA